MFARMRSIWRSFRHRTRFEGELDAEMQSHIEARADDLMRTGVSREDAVRRARIEFGCVESYQDRVRESRRISWFEDFAQDLRFGARMLRKSPGFTIVAVLTLALGIGANTAIFSVVNALLLRPLPIYAPHEIASLAWHDHAGYDNGFSYPDFEDIRNQTAPVFRDVAGVKVFAMDGFRMDGENQPIWMNFVTTNFFQVMGVQPALGTFFQPSDGTINGSEPVLVVSYSFWKSHLGGDPNIIGRNVSLNAHPVTIIGVAPKGFAGIFPIMDTQGYAPVGMAAVTSDSPKGFLTDRNRSDVTIVGRLKSGLELGAAQPVLSVIARRLAAQYPDIHKWDSIQAFRVGALGPVADPSGPAIIKSMAVLFLVLVALVLVLACMNVANLLLVRSSAREREMAVRTALGAARGRLVRQLLTESLLLALLGCAGGILIGVSVSRSVNSINFSSAIPLVFDVAFDWRVFAYAFGAALLTGMFVGLTPAIRAARGNLSDVLHESPRTGTARRQRTRSILVVAELSGSLMLLIVAGLFVRSLRSVEHADLGFDPDHLVNLSMAPAEAGYDKEQASQFLKKLLEQARALPGVESASLAASIPMGYYSYGNELKIDGYQTPKDQAAPSAGFNAVSPDYFRTMRISLIRGRGFVGSDGETSQNVAVVNEEMARRYWPNQDPLGRRFVAGTDSDHPMQVVGVVANVRAQNLAGPFNPYFYRPLAQNYQTPVSLQLRTQLPSATAFRETLDLIHSLEPAMPVFDVQTMRQGLDTLNGLLLYEIGAVLTGSLGILGLLLGLVGVYGVVSYAASQRTREIGIRMALGAAPSQVRQMVLGQGIVVIGIGVMIGALLAAAIGRLAGNFLSGVSPIDPLTYLCASALLALVALFACYLPARRAMRVDPMVALRHE